MYPSLSPCLSLSLFFSPSLSLPASFSLPPVSREAHQNPQHFIFFLQYYSISVFTHTVRVFVLVWFPLALAHLVWSPLALAPPCRPKRKIGPFLMLVPVGLSDTAHSSKKKKLTNTYTPSHTCRTRTLCQPSGSWRDRYIYVFIFCVFFVF